MEAIKSEDWSMPIQEGSVIFPLPDEAELKKREKRWHRTLPPACRAFLMKYNGAVPKDGSFFCHGRTYCITRFLCVLASVADSPLGQYDISVVESQIGERLTANEDLVGVEILPIAELFGGDYVCLDYREGRSEPVVCVWSHEESGEFDPVTYEAAGSFEGVISLFSQERAQTAPDDPARHGKGHL
ncbi:MAG: SMI1/KNR4 family protein [Lachnospiraceae bacterium]|nr:SMI1/KNR4 family protein [Lachnospiraceae bacterium]